MVDLLREVQADDPVPHHVAELLLPGLQHLVVGGEGLRILLGERDLFAGETAPAFVKGKF